MNFKLPWSGAFASCVVVRAMLIRLMVMFAVVMAGMHASATAHILDSDVHQTAHALDDHDATEKDGDSRSDIGGDLLHHHHCPIGLEVANLNNDAPLKLRTAAHAPSNAVVLSSRTTAPPLEPPLA